MIQERPEFITDKQHISIKNNLYHAIKKNDLEMLRKMMRLFQIEPSEEISTFSHQWTLIHYAVFFKSPTILEFLIQLTYLKHKNNLDNFINILNIPTKSGHTPLMVAAVYDAIDCLKILFKYGGIYVFKKDCSAMDCIKLALKYDSKDANDFIQEQIALNQFNDFIPINEDSFKNIPDLKTLLHQRYEVVMDEQEIIKNRDLLLYGEPISCIICLQNTGFLKYSNCCGQPLHQHCHAEIIIQCPLCKSNNFYLISEVLHPNRAFTFNPNDEYIQIQPLENEGDNKNNNNDNSSNNIDGDQKQEQNGDQSHALDIQINGDVDKLNQNDENNNNNNNPSSTQ